jgi:hypothetical protein
MVTQPLAPSAVIGTSPALLNLWFNLSIASNFDANSEELGCG